MLRGNRNNLFLLGHLSFVTKRRVNDNVCYEVCTDFFFYSSLKFSHFKEVLLVSISKIKRKMQIMKFYEAYMENEMYFRE